MELESCQIILYSCRNEKLTIEQFFHNLQCHESRGMTEVFLSTASTLVHQQTTFQFVVHGSPMQHFG